MDLSSSDWERLDRYVAGRASPDEMAALRTWVSADPERRALAEAMRAVGRPSTAEERPWDVSTAWQRLRRRMAGGPLRLLSPTLARRTVPAPSLASRDLFPGRRALAIAAGVVLVITAALVGLARWRSAPIALRGFATRRSQTAVLELPDGSRVTLAPASQLRLPADDGALRAGAARDIYLEGEAYLEVKHDAAHRFRVHTASGIVEDVGTEFLVSAYPDVPGMQVVVATGAVALYQHPLPLPGPERSAAPPRPLLNLAAGDRAELAVTGVATVTHHVNVAPYVAWTQGNLAFDGTRLGDVLPALERWYDAEIRLGDRALADRRLTATFRRQSLPQVLELLALSLDLRVARNGRTVLLYPRSPAPARRED